MPTPTFQPLGGEPTTQQIQDYIVKLIRDLNFMLENLDNKNVVNVAGFRATETELMSKNQMVGMSSDGVDPTSIRFWAGDVKTGTPNFKVTQAGILTAIAGAFMTALGYPKVTLNESADSLLKASLNATHYIYIDPNFVGGAPGLLWQDPSSSMQMFIAPNGTGDFIMNPTQKIKITSSSNDVHLECATGHVISVNSWNELYNRFNSQSLQTALNAKANTFSGVSGTVYVSSTSGGPATTPITFSNGIRTS